MAATGLKRGMHVTRPPTIRGAMPETVRPKRWDNGSTASAWSSLVLATAVTVERDRKSVV